MKRVSIFVFCIILFFICFIKIKAVNVEDGLYIIRSSLSNNMVVDVKSGSSSNGTNIQLYQNNNSDAQKWIVKKLDNGYYYITSKINTAKSLDVKNGGAKAGTNVQLYSFNATNAQMWKISDAGNGYYYINSKCNGLNLDVSGGNAKNGTNIQVYSPNNSAAQKFKFEKIWNPEQTIEDGDYYINTSLNSNKYLDLSNGYKNSSNIQIYDFENVRNQQWHVEYLNNGYYKISSLDNPDYVLDVAGGNTKNGTNVQLYKSNNSAAQQWAIKNLGDGYYTIISRLGNFVLDVSGGNINNETNIQIYSLNNSAAQKFKFEKIWVPEQTIEDGNYIISTSLDMNKSLDIYNGNFVNSSNIQLYNLNSDWNQIWHVEYLNNGYYKIANAIEPDYVLDVSGGSKVSGANVQLYKSNNSAAQQWAIKNLGDGYYTIISRLGNFVLDVSGGNINNGTNIEIYSPNNSAAQKFSFKKTSAIPLKDGLYKIGNSSNNSNVISIYENYIHNGANIILSSDLNSNGQKWHVKYIKNGYYLITSSFSNNYSLDVTGGNTNIGTNVQLYKTNGSDAQQWYVKYVDGNYVILSKLNNNAVSATNKETNENNEEDINVEIDSNKKENNQKFIFEETELNEEEIPEYGISNVVDGYYTISSFINNGYVIDALSGSRLNGTNIQIYSTNFSLAQIWHLQSLGDGYYYITSALNRSTSLDVTNGSTSIGTNIQLYKQDNTDAQKWIIKDTGDGYVTIVSKLGNFALDLDSINVSNGTNVYLNELTYSKTQKFKLTPYTGTKIYKGIDVSSHNGNINWQQAASNIDFAILRLGYGGVDDGENDSQFVANAKACEEYNIPYGVYLYSYAIDSANDTQVEVNHIKKILPNYHPNLGTKVFFDMEDADGWKKKYGIDNNNALLTAISNNFCTGVQNSGYSCGIYANANWLNTKLDAKMLADKFTIWVAIWPDNSTINNFSTAYNLKPSYTTTDYKYWQFTSNGRISGINGSVDLNLGYDIFD